MVMRIFAGVSWRGGQTTVGLSKTAILVLSLVISSEVLEVRLTLLYNIILSRVGRDNIFGEGHVYKLEVCTMLLNILRLLRENLMALVCVC